MWRRTSGTVALALVAAGCGAMAQKDADRTPTNPTAVLETSVENVGGHQDFPSFESTTRTYTRGNMQRRDATVKGAVAYARTLGIAPADIRIERLDRKTTWTLDAKNKQYIQCPLKGCPVPVPRKPAAAKPTDDVSARDNQCRMRIGSTTFSVEPTGHTRNINGFNSDRYDVTWIVTFRDKASRKSTGILDLVVWTTPGSPEMDDAAKLEIAYARAHDSVSGVDSVGDHSLTLPPEVGKMISGHLSSNVSPGDRASLLAALRKVENVKGQPTLLSATWRLAGDACAPSAPSGSRADKPLFTFKWELKSLRVDDLHDSVFTPPKGYKRRK